MTPDVGRREAAAVAAPWVLGVAVLWLWAGPGLALNPFGWLLALKEFAEFLLWAPRNLSSIPMFVAAFPSWETLQVVAGALGFAGWAALAYVALRGRST